MYKSKLKPKSVLFPLLLSIVALLAGYGAGEARTDPDFDPKLAGALQAALDKSKATGVIGVTMAVIIPGEGMWVGASGVSDREAQTPMLPGDRLRIASITKTFVAAAVLQMAQEGVLTLDEPLKNYVPDFPNGSKITIRQLLNHTSGIVNYTDDETKFVEAAISDLNKVWHPEELIAYATTHEPYFAPGTDWHYSNTNYILLGMVIEAATGSTVERELRRRFFEPLQLEDTFFSGAEEIPGGLAHSYTDLDSDGRLEDFGTLPDTSVVTAAWTTGGLVSTAGDLARWALALYSGQVLDKASLDEMLTCIDLTGYDRDFILGLFGVEISGYGLGVERLDLIVGPALGHIGGVIGTTAMFHLPDIGVTIVILANQVNANIEPIFVSALSALQRNGWIYFPVLFYKPETKLAGGGAVGFYFREPKSQRDSRPSTIIPTFIYTQNRQFISELFADVYWKNEAYHLTGDIDYVKFPDTFYGIGNQTAASLSEDYTHRTTALSIELQKRVRPGLNLGLRYAFASSKITEVEANGLLAKRDILGSEGGKVSGTGLLVNFDTRNHVFTPSSGRFYQFSATRFDRTLGSDYRFSRYNLDLRGYFPFLKSHVLAFQGYINLMTGDVPFQMLSQFGGDSLMRGYFQGRYRDKNLITFQAEYRLPVWRRFGLVGFVGLGDVADKVQNFSPGDFKYAAGWGVRYLFNSEEEVNLRLDFGYGKNSSGVYLGLTEAF